MAVNIDMRFTRGKSLADPIYLRHSNKSEFWMMGDIYEAACNCFDVIFRGRKNYFVDSFSPKMVDFMSEKEYYKCCVTDKDGDSHTFVVRVVETLPGETRRPPQTTPAPVPQPPPLPPPPPEPVSEPKQEEPKQESTPEPETEPIELEELNELKQEAKQEVEVEKLNMELEKENLLTKEPEFDNIPVIDDEPKSKPKRKTRGRGKRKQKTT